MVNTPRRQPERAPLAPTQSSPTLTRQLTATAVMTLLATGCGPELIIEPHSMGYTVTATEGTSTLTIDDVPAESLNHLKIAWNWDELLEAAHQIDIEGDYTKTTIEGRIESCPDVRYKRGSLHQPKWGLLKLEEGIWDPADAEHATSYQTWEMFAKTGHVRLRVESAPEGGAYIHNGPACAGPPPEHFNEWIFHEPECPES